jgi:hypothetical protein
MKQVVLLCLMFLTGCGKFMVADQSPYPAFTVSQNNNTRIKMSTQSLVAIRPFPGVSPNYLSSLPTFDNIASVVAPTSISTTNDVQATSTVLSGNYAYISYNMSGDEVFGAIDIVNITDPSNPSIEYTYTSSDFEFSDLRIKDNYLLLAGYRKESTTESSSAILMVLDISSKISPVIKKIQEVPGIYATSMDLLDNKVLINTGTTGGLYKYDVSNPENPTLISSVVRQNGLYAKLGGSFDYSLSGSSDTKLELLGKSDSGLDVPLNSSVLIANSPSEAPSRFVRQNALMYVNNSKSGKLHILDLSQSLVGSVSQITSIPLVGTANGIIQDQQVVYVAQGEKGVYAIDVSNPSTPQILGSFDFNGDDGSANNLWIDQNSNGKFLFLADGRQGIRILKENTPVPLPTSIISFYARSMDYQGSADVNVKVNGVYFTTVSLTGTEFNLYNVTYSRPLNSTDVVEIVFANDQYAGTWSTDRNAMIAYLKVNGNYCYIQAPSASSEDTGLFSGNQTLSASQNSCNNPAPSQICISGQDKIPNESCSLSDHRLGKLVCDSTGYSYQCNDTGSCDSGYALNTGVCSAIVCQPGVATQDCSDSVSNREQTCNSNGTGFGSCTFSSCKAGNILVNGQCVAQVCSPNSTVTCSIVNGSGAKTCNSDGSVYGACTTGSCNSGYYLSGGTCVAQVCNPNTTQACVFMHATGSKTCDSQGASYGSCNTGTTCESGYHYSLGVCVADTCQPNSISSCSVANGIGSQTCDSQGSAYGSCQVYSCNVGFYQSGNLCVAQTCTPNSTQSCTNNHLIGNQTCTANGSSFGSCSTGTTCEAGFYYDNGSCVVQTCSPNTSESCSIPNGTGSHTCSSNGSAYGLCQLATCNSGYYLDHGACVAQQCAPNSMQSCVSNHLMGTQSCNSVGSSYGSCTTTNVCESGYFYSNGSCLAQSCSPNSTISCTENNGLGTKTCSNDGSAYGTCAINSCNSGFNKTAVPGPEFTYCANENQNCEFLGTVNVRYGVGTVYDTKSVSNGVACNNTEFSDLSSGMTKHCDIQGSFVCEAQLCPPNSIDNCSVNNGVGTKTCNTTGTAYGSCQLTACNNGYYNNAGSCAVQSCAPNSIANCTENHLLGSKTCDSQGSAYGSCVTGTTCDSGYNYSGGVCQANICTPSSTSGCSVANGTGVHTCDPQGSAYGSCTTTSCNSGFYNNSGSCVAQSCTPAAVQTCTYNHFVGVQTCNSQGSGYSSCLTGVTCEAGYYNNGVSCLPQVCAPNTNASCSSSNGTGSYTCNTQGSGYGACAINQCNSGYNLVSGACVAQICSPNASIVCSENNGSGTKTCNSNGTAYGSCTITSCNAGFYNNAGTCTAQVCIPNASNSCSVANGTGSQTCNSTGSSVGDCSVTSCNSGYSLSNGACVVNSNACTVPNGSGTLMTYNSSGTTFTHSLTSDYITGYAYLFRIDNNSSVNVPDWSVCFYYNYNVGNLGISNADIDSSSSKPNWKIVPKSYNKIIYPGSNVSVSWNASPGNVGTDRLTNIKVFNSSTAACSDIPIYSSAPVCTATSCSSGYHVESNLCVSNTKACTVPNGTGTQTWNGTAYGVCTNVTCNSSSYALVTVNLSTRTHECSLTCPIGLVKLNVGGINICL